MFILVRHAHAGDKHAWRGPDRDRPLSAMGRRQAAGLARNPTLLHGRRLLSSPYRRCVQTLEPMAERLGAPIEIDDVLEPDPAVPSLVARLLDPAMDGAVLCTHGETLTVLLRHWHRHATVALPLDGRQVRKGATEKGGAWVVADDGDGWQAHYLRPVAWGP